MTRTGTSRRSAPKETNKQSGTNKAKSSTSRAASKAKEGKPAPKTNSKSTSAASSASAGSRRASKGRDEETRARIDSGLKDLVSSSTAGASKGSTSTAPVRKSERQAKGASVAATTKAFDRLMK
ncbi:hypothetical protein CF326_g4913 [Tilletia indica]|nr:hypothetical protein CF326_g4913 [Tilletia indica]